MNIRKEGVFAIVAALLVLLSAMWDARISVAVSVFALVALGIFEIAWKDKK